MAKHRVVSRHSVHARTVVGGVFAAGAVMLAAPAGIALADTQSPPSPNPAIMVKQPPLKALIGRIVRDIKTDLARLHREPERKATAN
jgi:hypothetical protein